MLVIYLMMRFGKTGRRQEVVSSRLKQHFVQLRRYSLVLAQ